MEGLGVLSDDESQFEIGHRGKKRCPPGRGTFGARGKVAGCTGARIAEAHREDCDEFGVIELFDGEASPKAEAVAAGVGKRNSGFVDFAAGGLASDQDFCSGSPLKDRSRPERKVGGADCARTHLLEQLGFVHKESRLVHRNAPTGP